MFVRSADQPVADCMECRSTNTYVRVFEGIVGGNFRPHKSSKLHLQSVYVVIGPGQALIVTQQPGAAAYLRVSFNYLFEIIAQAMVVLCLFLACFGKWMNHLGVWIFLVRGYRSPQVTDHETKIHSS